MNLPKGKILVFGARAHIGGPLAAYLTYKGWGEALRLATSAEANLSELQRTYPRSESVVVDYLDAAAMERAMDNVERAFIITPDFLDEKIAMSNLVQAAKRSNNLRQIVRVLGDPPAMTLAKVPPTVRAFGGGTAIQHLQAKEILDASGLPLTYVNIAAYLMDDLIRWSEPIRTQGKLLMPFERRTTWIDPTDLGEAVAHMFLEQDDGHLGQHYHLNNGSDHVTFAEIAEMISDVLQKKIVYEPSPDVWRQVFSDRYQTLFGDGADDYYLEYYAFEQRCQFAFHRSDLLARLLGRTPKTLRAWIEQNQHYLQ
ncbi:NmrA family NAD(P)-binding protein [Kineobactrum salinum]|uniref:NmrA family NAD(P)-binding protein n=1 Tax=Kineobactrum salinum TaxID=2708301 RepID=A0A6C0U3V6_9GAMM|nr:NmrA family NAD(P)-binding protein [Kineobactrum salinum]QIB64114.1 NmrA family NAD(P)-binding protein [Kineobactrum salinum]